MPYPGFPLCHRMDDGQVLPLCNASPATVALCERGYAMILFSLTARIPAASSGLLDGPALGLQ